ncbi:hypothetical protein FIBSPDRAFT_901345 [Athelia psychrophila]|uniref:Uncharacterized protein n=1 Tax=Athelia psychrophila TaxID=1759441 RepID=A0A165X8X5_9AGAM|nr:hypothetical protein FIBSPDRAFT_901345 [Fibularhizoctonia sp. CBS 109695]
MVTTFDEAMLYPNDCFNTPPIEESFDTRFDKPTQKLEDRTQQYLVDFGLITGSSFGKPYKYRLLAGTDRSGILGDTRILSGSTELQEDGHLRAPLRADVVYGPLLLTTSVSSPARTRDYLDETETETSNNHAAAAAVAAAGIVASATPTADRGVDAPPTVGRNHETRRPAQGEGRLHLQTEPTPPCRDVAERARLIGPLQGVLLVRLPREGELGTVRLPSRYTSLDAIPPARPVGRYDPPADKSRLRDWYYTCKFVTVTRFPYHNWQTVAADNKLVIVGSDRRLLSQPGVKWLYKATGGNGLTHMATLMARIPEPDNTFYNLPEGALSLKIIPLDDFYVKFPKLRGPRAPAVVDYDATVLVWAAYKDENPASFCENYKVIPIVDAGSAKSTATGKSRRLVSKPPTRQPTQEVPSDPEEEMTLVAPQSPNEPWSPSAVPSPPRQMATKRARFDSPGPASHPRRSPTIVGKKRKATSNDHYTNPAAESPYRPTKALPARAVPRPVPSHHPHRSPIPRVISRESAPMLPPDRARDDHQYQLHTQHSRPHNDHSVRYHAAPQFAHSQPREDHSQYHHQEDPYHDDHLVPVMTYLIPIIMIPTPSTKLLTPTIYT